jgi:hypothetical protein
VKSVNETARDIINELTIEWVRGYQVYLVAKNVHSAREKKRISSINYFFDTVEFSCQETVVITLSKLLIVPKNKRYKSITIPYLLEYVSKNPSGFPNVSGTLLANIVSQRKMQIASLQPFINNLSGIRDQTAAHNDELHVMNPASITNTPLVPSEVENAFRIVQDIINEFGNFLEPPFIKLQDLPENPVIREVERLIQLFEEDDAKE